MGLSIEGMWDNREQSGDRGHLRWYRQCIKGSEGHFVAMVECLGDPHVGVQGPVLSIVKLWGNSCTHLAPGLASPWSWQSVPPSPHPFPHNSVMFFLL